ncbi:MAG: hypothetical protein ACO25F_08235 [Erythrobacter sp.]
MMVRSAVAYLCHGNLVVAPIVHTTDGVGVEVDPIVIEEIDAVSVAGALTGALRHSDRIIPHPAQVEWKDIFKPFLKAVGVRSYKSFMASAKRIEIVLDGDWFVLVPQENLGSSKGFAAIPDAEIRFPGTDIDGMTRCLLKLIEG